MSKETNAVETQTKDEKPELVLPKEVAALGTKFGSTSNKIRMLTELKWKRVDISKILGIAYQHVRNVQMQPPKKDRQLK